MQEEYKKSMKSISLSEADKARILANARKAYEQMEEADEAEKKANVFPMFDRPRFSARKMGAAAAACLVLLASVVLIRDQFKNGEPGIQSDLPVVTAGAVSGDEFEIWTQYDSIDDIQRNTDCKTYVLDHVPKSYKVKKVEVANEKRHVRITYENKKEKDEILFEYVEREHAPDITEQFEDANEIKKEKVDGSVVTMYGEDKCDAMSWEKESCTFSVRMTKPRSTKSAKALIYVEMESIVDVKEPRHDSSEKEPKESLNPNAVGWQEDDFVMEDQDHSILREFKERKGFYVKVKEPADEIVYKAVDDYESFAFVYTGDGELEDHQIIGYAGWEGSPEGVFHGYDTEEVFEINDIEVLMYQHKKNRADKIFVFKEKGIELTILLDHYKGSDMEAVLADLFDVLEVVNVEEDEKPVETEKPKEKNTSASPSAIDEETEKHVDSDESEANKQTSDKSESDKTTSDKSSLDKPTSDKSGSDKSSSEKSDTDKATPEKSTAENQVED